jgi:hypothetical protein
MVQVKLVPDTFQPEGVLVKAVRATMNVVVIEPM